MVLGVTLAVVLLSTIIRGDRQTLLVFCSRGKKNGQNSPTRQTRPCKRWQSARVPVQRGTITSYWYMSHPGQYLRLKMPSLLTTTLLRKTPYEYSGCFNIRRGAGNDLRNPGHPGRARTG